MKKVACKLKVWASNHSPHDWKHKHEMLKSTMRHKVDLSCQIAAWICDLFKKSTHRSCTKFAKIKSKKLPQIKSDKKISHSRIKASKQQYSLISMRLIYYLILEPSFDMALFQFFWRFAKICKKFAALECKIVFVIVSEQFFELRA